MPEISQRTVLTVILMWS